MNTQETNEKVVIPIKKNRRKKGLKYMLIAVAFLVVNYLMYSAGLASGIIYGLVSLAMVIFFVIGLIFLIGGFVGKG